MTKKCKHCGEGFEYTRYRKMFCNKKCSIKYRQKIARKKRECPNCKEFYKPRAKHKYGRFCSFLCKGRERNDDSVGAKLEEYHTKENEFSMFKYKYSDKLIDYQDSPTGKAYIGLAKQPLMKHKKGYGYQGVLMQTENRELVQCAECGKWLRRLTGMHLGRHNLVRETYNEKYGLNKTTSLISDRNSIEAANRMNDNILFRKRISSKKNIDNLFKNYTSGNKKRSEGKLNYKRSRELENLHGTCPEQLKAEIINYVKRFHRLPSHGKRSGGFTKATTVRTRFGSMNNALKACGLPIRNRLGRDLFEYIFSDKTSFHTKGGKGYEELYQLMLDKCPILNQ